MREAKHRKASGREVGRARAQACLFDVDLPNDEGEERDNGDAPVLYQSHISTNPPENKFEQELPSIAHCTFLDHRRPQAMKGGMAWSRGNFRKVLGRVIAMSERLSHSSKLLLMCRKRGDASAEWTKEKPTRMLGGNESD